MSSDNAYQSASRRRSEHDYDVATSPATISYTAEAMRMAASAPPKSEEKISLFWRIFGGSILSITALVCIQAYQAMASTLHDLRADQNRLRELAGDFVKKDEFSNRTTTLWNRVQELQNLQSAITVAGSKLAAMESQLAQVDRERKEVTTSLAAEHKEVVSIATSVQGLRDKDQNIERKLADAEIERRELLKELQTLRERLAKLEGQAQPAGPNKTTFTTRY
jgi:DNA repair exonuclease SbcCD ATPase subunit